MKRRIITTGDGTHTVFIEDWNEYYHSKHGAIQESEHVFIQSGLSLFENQTISLLEIGFGTGLNAFLTLLHAPNKGLKLKYKGIEAYPVKSEELKVLNYAQHVSAKNANQYFLKIHQIPWETFAEVTPDFQLQKKQMFFQEIQYKEEFNLIYFDAFGARVQPELWTETIFKKMYEALKSRGVLVTYAAKGSVRRAMLSVGFTVEKLPGPPGKREMLRATKP